jgi:hypothetical protein
MPAGSDGTKDARKLTNINMGNREIQLLTSLTTILQQTIHAIIIAESLPKSFPLPNEYLPRQPSIISDEYDAYSEEGSATKVRSRGKCMGN